MENIELNIHNISKEERQEKTARNWKPAANHFNKKTKKMETITKKRNSWLNIFSMIVLSIVVGMSSCEKTPTEPEPDLPPLTTSGRMTFGCYVNGEPWVAEVPPFQPYHRHTGGGLHYNLDSIMLIFGNRINQIHNEIIDVPFRIVSQPTFKSKIGYSHTSILYNNYRNTCDGVRGDFDYDLDTTYNNEVEVVYFDIEKRIISGTFEMRVISRKCKDTLYMTDGRFDINFTITE